MEQNGKKKTQIVYNNCSKDLNSFLSSNSFLQVGSENKRVVLGYELEHQ